MIKNHPGVLLLIAAFSPDKDILEQSKQRAINNYGPILLESEFFRFDEFTPYYAAEMGEILYKQLWTFERLIDPGTLPDIKIVTNSWEAEVAHDLNWDIREEGPKRPINLDPGYIDLGKLILASTKDHAHRIYLRNGIFAETTLMYRSKQWQALPWSYPDYQSEGYQCFLTEARSKLHELRKLFHTDPTR